MRIQILLFAKQRDHKSMNILLFCVASHDDKCPFSSHGCCCCSLQAKLIKFCG